MRGESTPAFVMVQSRKRLVRSPKVGPSQMVGKGERLIADTTKEQPPDFSNAERDHHPKIGKDLGLNGVGNFRRR
jgi:hypothetical protein